MYKGYGKDDLENLLRSEERVIKANSISAAMTLRNVLSIIGAAFDVRDNPVSLEDTLTQVLDTIDDHRVMLERSVQRVKRLRFLLGKK